MLIQDENDGSEREKTPPRDENEEKDAVPDQADYHHDLPPELYEEIIKEIYRCWSN